VFSLVLPLGASQDSDLDITASTASESELWFHSVVPLGVETVRLQPAHTSVNLMASATSPAFEGMKRLKAGANGAGFTLVSTSGRRVNFFPDQVFFRVTASSRGDALEPEPLTFETKEPAEELMLHFQFRLRIFHGLEWRELDPAKVEMIGMPADVSYPERIYLVRFDLHRVPADDRLLLQILDSSGQRLCRFHLDLL
jgi:hypothetical protein